MSTAYQALLERVRETHLLGSTAGVLGWDQETMLPAGGVAWRARQLAQLARLSHEMGTSPEFADLLARCETEAPLTEDPESDSAANLRELRRAYDRQRKLAPTLVAELAETQSLAQHAWAEARKNDDFAAFQPWLQKMVDLQRQKAAAIGRTTGEGPHGEQEDWDVLADGFEPGVRATRLEELFRPLQERLAALIGELRDDGTPPDTAFHQVRIPIDQQEAFVRRVALAIGFDQQRGRIDRSTHPFCSGSHPGDVRITTRFHDDFVLDALGSTMHEAGHAIYEQGLPAEHAGTPLGQAVSLGVHESQSRLWENHVGRSRAFWSWCAPELRAAFGPAVAGYDAERLFRTSNVVEPSLIRVEADEATYDLHVIVRFELERALIRGDLSVDALPSAWNARYRELLGVDVPDDARGCLQDVHWSCGLFGYFPTYTLGNLFAAQVFATAARELPTLQEDLARGEFAGLRGWLRRNVHAHGSRYPADELCERVTGAPLAMDALLDHLERKLRPIYGL